MRKPANKRTLTDEIAIRGSSADNGLHKQPPEIYLQFLKLLKHLISSSENQLRWM